MNKTNTKELRGTYGVYPSSGYVVDFDSDRALNKKKLETLDLENWIDSDTRAIQVLWTIRSSWSQTLFTFQASLEWSGNAKSVHLGDKDKTTRRVRQDVWPVHHGLGHPSEDVLLQMWALVGATKVALVDARSWACLLCEASQMPAAP